MKRIGRICITPAFFNPDAGRILTMEEWERTGGWDRLRPGFRAARGDWAVVGETVADAKARLRRLEKERK